MTIALVPYSSIRLRHPIVAEGHTLPIGSDLFILSTHRNHVRVTTTLDNRSTTLRVPRAVIVEARA